MYPAIITLFIDFNSTASTKNGNKRDVEEKQCYRSGTALFIVMTGK